MAKFGDPLFENAAILVVSLQQVSASIIQRRLSIGLARAGKIVDFLEYAGIIGPFAGRQDREVLISNVESLKPIFEQLPDYDPFDIKEPIDYAELEKQKIESNIKEKYRKKQLGQQIIQELQEKGELPTGKISPSPDQTNVKSVASDNNNFLEIIKSQQRTIENLSETIQNLTNK